LTAKNLKTAKHNKERLKATKSTKLKKDILKKLQWDLYISNVQTRFFHFLKPNYLTKKTLKVLTNFFCRTKVPLKPNKKKK
jgi:hypothetical protein